MLGKGVKELEMATLHDGWMNCDACPLAKLRKQVVFGHGNLNASLMIIGEAPGEQEDNEGRPFIGQAGIWLSNILKMADIPREEVYITNTCLCRPKKEPKGNRAPLVDEIDACKPRLLDEIEIVRPRIIVLCGNTPYFMATGKRGGVTKDHGRLDWTYTIPAGHLGPQHEAVVFLSIHPASLLYGTKEQVEEKKAIAKQDWQDIAHVYHNKELR